MTLNDAERARELILGLMVKAGSLCGAARLFAERYDRKPKTVEMRFRRILAGQRGLMNPDLIDELESM